MKALHSVKAIKPLRALHHRFSNHCDTIQTAPSGSGINLLSSALEGNDSKYRVAPDRRMMKALSVDRLG